MRGVVWIVLLFTVAVVAASTLGTNDGLVSIYWRGWRTDLSLNLFLILLLVACTVGLLATHAISRVVSLPKRAAEWRALRRERGAEAALREALAEHFGARYGRARKAAQKALTLAEGGPMLGVDTEFRLLAQLLGAASMHRLQDRRGRDDMLREALHALQAPQGGVPSPRGDHAVANGLRLLAAEWALDDRDPARSIEMLDALAPGAARRTQALRLKLQAMRMDRRPLEAMHIARLLANHQAFSPVVGQGLLRALAAETLDDAHDLQQLRRLWNQFDEADRRDVPVLVRAAARAVQLGAPDEARQWLRPRWQRLGDLERAERDAVVLALFDAREGIGSDWLPALEAALQTHGHEGAVQAAAGACFAECGLWGRAIRPLEQAAASTQLPARVLRAAWRELARLARQQGDAERAAHCDRAAAAVD
jgi:HemY protein